MIDRNRKGTGMGVRVNTRAKDPEELAELRKIIDEIN